MVSQVASAVANNLNEAKSLILGPPGSAVTLRLTREETMKK
jgi:hypothetical protein